MRCFFLPLLLCLVFKATASPVSTFDKLADVNKCWKEQADLTALSLPPYSEKTDEAWIKLHLSLVEKVLRSRDCKSLNPQQRKNRLACLDHLHSYMLAGKLPQNEDYAYRTPIFIDKHDNFCAVGYLIKASGYEKISRMIQSKTNLAYVRQMKYPELLHWASDHGFSVDELAWIQPSYAPKEYLKPVGKGLQGEVLELFADSAGKKLYAGGNFAMADSSITVNNIAYVTVSGNTYTWHAMGTGTNGNVHAITLYNGNIFVAGNFTSAGGSAAGNVAYWDGSGWHTAGCLDGLVKDLVVFNGDLYAAGDFDLCNTSGEVNFARWNGTAWQALAGLSGRVNTMEVRDTFLFLGGAFSYNATQVNAIKWNPNTGFQQFGNNIRNEVNDFAIFYDTVYTVCKFTASGDTSLCKRLIGNNWDSLTSNYYPSRGTLSFNTLCVQQDTFIAGGDFYYSPILGTYIANSINVARWGLYGGSFLADSAINKMTVFDNSIFAGGKFTMGIGRRYNPIPIPVPFSLTASSSVSCKNSANATAVATGSFGIPPYTFLWSTGQTTKSITNLLPGTYIVVGTDAKGAKDTATVNVFAYYIDTTLTKVQNVLTTYEAFPATYQWVNCDSGYMPVNGATAATFVAKNDGNYAVIINKFGCIDTSLCYNISMNGNPNSVEIASNPGSIEIFPNPATDVLNIIQKEPATEMTCKVYDITGRLLLQNDVTGKRLQLDIHSLSPGMYTLVLSSDKGYLEAVKFVRQLP